MAMNQKMTDKMTKKTYGGEGKSGGKTPFLGEVKAGSTASTTAFLNKDTLKEAKPSKAPKARLKPTFSGKVPTPKGAPLKNGGQP